MNENKRAIDSIMVDLETMAFGPNAGIIQIGAVAFDSVRGEFSPDVFEVGVDLHSALLAGGEVDAEVVQWWRNRGGLKFDQPPKDIRSALVALSGWLSKFPDKQRIWAQGPSFDIANLEGYARRLGLPVLWPYNAPKDTRTIYDQAQEFGWVKLDTGEPKHQAVMDCLDQINCLCQAKKYIRSLVVRVGD